MTLAPLRDELRGLEPYGAPQLDVPVQLNVNENPYPPSPASSPTSRAQSPRPRARSTATPTASSSRCASALAHLSRPHGVTPEQVWAANGSNEVMLQLLQAFGGPGPDRAELRADLLDVSGVRPGHLHPWVTGTATPTSPSTSTPRRADRESSDRRVVLLPSPNNPTGTALPPAAVTALRDALGRRAGGRRRGLRRVPPSRDPERARAAAGHRNLVVTRTMSKAFALAGAGWATSPPTRRWSTAARRPTALPPVGGHPGGRAGGARHAAELLGSVDALRAERDAVVVWLRGQGPRVADCDANFVLFGTSPTAMPSGRVCSIRRPDPGDRSRGLAAGQGRHAGGDGRVQGRAHSVTHGEGMNRTARIERQTKESRSSSSSTSTALAAPMSRRGSASTTTCWRVGRHGWST